MASAAGFSTPFIHTVGNLQACSLGIVDRKQTKSRGILRAAGIGQIRPLQVIHKSDTGINRPCAYVDKDSGMRHSCGQVPCYPLRSDRVGVNPEDFNRLIHSVNNYSCETKPALQAGPVRAQTDALPTCGTLSPSVDKLWVAWCV